MQALGPNEIRYTLTSLPAAADWLLKATAGRRVLVFQGSLGAGKTTLVRALCQQLGIAASAISSPTFSIINEYLLPQDAGFSKIYHMDWYRLRDEEEAFQAGVEDALNDPGALCLVEWPERAPGLLQQPYAQVTVTQPEGAPQERVLHYMLSGHHKADATVHS